MKRNSTRLEIGDSVTVREGVMCPDMEGLCIGGWQGKVSEVGEGKDGNTLIGIRWDGITLKNLPDHFIEQSEEEGLDCTRMYLWQDDVKPVECRDAAEW